MIKGALFNTEMVCALLDDRKTATRRLVKPQPPKELQFPYGLIGSSSDKSEEGKFCWTAGEICDGRVHTVRPPYRPGDVIYVRETWCALPVTPGGHMRGHDVFYYKADGDLRPDGWRENWKPSLHMPREAARIFLRVTNVRAERLQDITEEQAVREGCITFSDKTGNGKFDDVLEFDLTARDAFTELWNSTLKKDSAYTWAHNPWVWVIEFERISKEVAYNA